MSANLRVWDINLKHYTSARGLDGATINVSDLNIPRVSVTPEVSGSPTRKILRRTDADESNSRIIGWRITIAAGDPVIAGERLAEHGEDTTFIPIDSARMMTVDSDEAYSVYVVCVANTAFDNASGVILPTGTSEADTRTAMEELEFPASTKLLEFVIGQNYEISSKLWSMLTVEGRSYA